MDTAVIAGIVRTLLASLAGYLAGQGIDISGFASPEVTAAVVTIVVSIWSAVSKKPKPPRLP